MLLAEAARVQASHGDVDAALRTIEGIDYDDTRSDALRQVVEVLVQSGKLADARDFAELADDQTSGDVWLTIAKGSDNAADLDRVRAVIEHIEDASERAAQLLSLAKHTNTCSDFDAACRATDELPFDRFRAAELLDIAESMAERDQLAWRTAETFKRNETQAPVVRALARVLLRQGEVGVAGALVAQIADMERRAHGLHALVSVLVRRAEIDDARDLAKTIEHPRVKVAALLTVATSTGNMSDFELARLAAAGTGEHIKDHELASVARAVAQSGNAKDAFNFVEFIEDEVIHSGAATSVASSLCESGELEVAHRIVDSISNIELRGGAEVGMVESLMKGGHLNQARRIASSIDHPDSRSTALLAIARITGESRDFDAVRIVSTSEQSRDAEGQALLAIARALLKRGHVSAARGLVEAIEHEVRRADAVIAVARSTQQESDWQAAREVTHAIEYVVDRMDALLAVAVGTGSKNDFEIAYTASLELVDPMERQEVLQSLAVGAAGQGDARTSSAFINAMDDSSKDKGLSAVLDELARRADLTGLRALVALVAPLPWVQKYMHGHMARLLGQHGDVATALEMTRANPYFRALILLDVANSTGQIGDLDTARRAAEAIDNVIERVDLMLSIAKETRATADFDAVRSLAKGVAADCLAASRLVALASASGETGDFDAARRATEAATYTYREERIALLLMLAEQARDPKIFEIACGQMMAESENKWTSNLKLLPLPAALIQPQYIDIARHMTSTLANWSDRASAWLWIANATGDPEDFAAAASVVQGIDDSEADDVRRRIADALASKGDIDAAFRLIEAIDDTEHRGSAHGDIVRSLTEWTASAGTGARAEAQALRLLSSSIDTKANVLAAIPALLYTAGGDPKGIVDALSRHFESIIRHTQRPYLSAVHGSQLRLL